MFLEVVTSPDKTEEVGWRSKSPPRTTTTLYPTKDKKKNTVFTYDNTPWNLRVRKELFYPNETLDDDEVLDLIFYQIINDCLDPNPFRIKKNEREQVLNQLSKQVKENKIKCTAPIY